MLGVPLYDTVSSGSLGDYQPFGKINCFDLQRELPTALQGVATQKVMT
jgi:hypothetical protein